MFAGGRAVRMGAAMVLLYFEGIRQYLKNQLYVIFICTVNETELYHGSPVGNIEILEPRRARNGFFPSRLEVPAVYATSDIDYAIFMAVIGNRRWGGWNGKEFGGKGFYIYEEFTEYLDPCKYYEPTGSVYFLNAEGFELNTGHEWRNRSLVRVLGSLAVGVKDLPHMSINYQKHPSHNRSIENKDE